MHKGFYFYDSERGKSSSHKFEFMKVDEYCVKDQQ